MRCVCICIIVVCFALCTACAAHSGINSPAKKEEEKQMVAQTPQNDRHDERVADSQCLEQKIIPNQVYSEVDGNESSQNSNDMLAGMLDIYNAGYRVLEEKNLFCMEEIDSQLDRTERMLIMVDNMQQRYILSFRFDEKADGGIFSARVVWYQIGEPAGIGIADRFEVEEYWLNKLRSIRKKISFDELQTHVELLHRNPQPNIFVEGLRHGKYYWKSRIGITSDDPIYELVKLYLDFIQDHTSKDLFMELEL